LLHELYEMTAGAGFNPAPAVISYNSCNKEFIHFAKIVGRLIIAVKNVVKLIVWMVIISYLAVLKQWSIAVYSLK